MSNDNQLTYEQRCQTEVLKKCGMTHQVRRKSEEHRYNRAKAVKVTEPMIEA